MQNHPFFVTLGKRDIFKRGEFLMWEHLPDYQKEKYKRLMTNFASLSEAFSQKSESNAELDGSEIVAPIVNSKFQETVFQRAFNAVGEDIANTSFDASLVVGNRKYLIGIKSFGIHSGDQKIAQFKKNSQEWSKLLSEIKFYAEISSNKKMADKENEERYKQLAIAISRLRNKRIDSSKAQIRGFQSQDGSVNSVYHVLMPTKRGEEPKIFVGETSYLPIDIDNLKILGSTNEKNPTNFKFTDGQHTYKYTAADSQLLMSFNNRNIVVDTWDVTYVEDPFHIFENLELLSIDKKEKVVQTVSWMIPNEDGIVEESSGYNAFDGATKLGVSERPKRIEKFIQDFSSTISESEMRQLKNLLGMVLLTPWKRTADMKQAREKLMHFAESLQNVEVLTALERMVYRPISELYIPIPNAKKFHQANPDFFGPAIGTFKGDTPKLKLSKKERVFTLVFTSSGDKIKAYVNQDNGKAIQSIGTQDILGKWLLKGVFQLSDRERLTTKRLEELEINGVRLSKFSNGEIGLEFIWIDKDNPPLDAIGWVAKKVEKRVK